MSPPVHLHAQSDRSLAELCVSLPRSSTSASTLLGCIGLVLAIFPLLILLFGKRLRARSKVASALLQEALEFEADRLRKKAEGEASRRGSTSHLPQAGALVV